MSEPQQADKPLSQRQQEQLDRHIADRVDGLLRSLQERVGEQVRSANQSLLQWLESQAPELPSSFFGDFDIAQLLPAPSPPPAAPAENRVGKLLESVAVIDGKADQAEILTSLLEEGLHFASRTAFFLIRQGQVRGWAGRGFDPDQTATYGVQAEAGPWAKLLESKSAVALDGEAAAEVCSALGSSADAALVVPFSIRGAISGALWAERDEGVELEAASLQLLAHAAAMALETAAVSPGASPALRLEGEIPPSAVTAVEPEEAEVATPEPEPAPEPEPEPEPVAVEEPTEPETSFEVTPTAAVVEPAEEPVVEPPVEEEPTYGVPEETAPVETVGEDYGVAPDPAPGVAEPAPTEIANEYDAQTEYVAVEEEDSSDEDDRYLPTDDEIALEAEPEPELEDTNIWELEEEDEEDDEPTQVGMAASVEPEPKPEVEPPPAVAAMEAAPIGQETVRIDVATIQKDQAALEAAAPPSDPGDETSPTMHALPHLAAPSAVSPPVEEPAPVEPVAPPAAEPEPPSSFAAPAPASFGSSPSSFAPPEPEPASFTSPPPPEPEPEEEEKPEAVGGSTEVVPPPDLDGPGLAFAAPEPAAAEQKINEGDAALHEEARRLARLLVSEIKLYNEEIIEEGRRSGNIYERLKDDIDRSRQMYEERIDPRLADQEDYFYQELVQRLAGGEERLLGM